METIKQLIKIPDSHEIKIKVPRHIPSNELVEIVLVVKKKKNAIFKTKIRWLEKSKSDKLFLEDMKNVLDDFKAVDLEVYDTSERV